MRWIVRGLGLLVLIVLLGAGALLLIPSKKIARLAEQQFEAATGRAMTLSDEVHPTLWPRLGVRTGAVTIANAAWSKAGPMLAAKGLDIGIDPMALIQGDIKVTKVEVLSPRILLERDAKGQGNWEFPAASGSGSGTAEGGAKGTAAPTETTDSAASGGGIQAFSLDKGVIKDGSVTWIDHGTGQKIALTKIDATLTIPKFTGPATLKMTAEANGKPLKLDGTLGEFSTFLGGKVVPVDLSSGIASSTIAFKGKLGTDPVAAQGALDATLKEPAALAALFGASAPDLPKGLGHDLVALKGNVTLAPEGSMHLRDGEVTLDGNHLTLASDVTFPKGRPHVSAQVGAGALDLTGLTAGSSSSTAATAQGGSQNGGQAATPASSGWSTDPIDVSGMQAVDADVALTADSIDFGAAKVGKTRIGVALNNGRAVVDLKQLQGYGGTVTGQMVANSRGGLSTTADLSAKGVAMQQLLGAFLDFKRLVANGDMTLKLAASGNSQAALVRSLSGSGRVGLGKGELQGLDLLGMLKTMNLNYVGAGAKTIFDSITASFTIDKGVLTNRDLSLKAPLLTAAGTGTVNLGDQTLNYTLTPTALEKSDGTGGISVPVTIQGPWAKPKFGLDLDALAKQKLDIEKGKLQDKAKSELAKKLGVTPDQGQSTQDAVKKKLQDEAKKGLLNLLK
ncbi:AsmA family protein [Acidimangrovimonas sediminis]|uniref:AsmA family protein n=1 Tax=Acidimangrovimonas sediminis TaxID=2056283 RepID=UPI000C7FAAA9|nr:AsmA family protein [Acidimangrovimonas sediminis]